MTTSTELLPAVLDVREPSPLELITHASDVAGACKAIVTQTARQIGAKKYVCVEGWQAIAIAHHCIASSRDVQRTETGIRAIGEVRRMDTGAVIASAEGFVGDDEPVWAGGGRNPKTGQPYEARPEFAKRAMAQTRAISRACRSAFAHIVLMLNAGLETTPAEEMEHEDGHTAPPAKAATAKAGLPAPPSAPTRGGATISDAQQKRLFAIARTAGHELGVLKQWLKDVCGVAHSKEITRDAYESICARLENPTPLTGDLFGDDAAEDTDDAREPDMEG